MRIYNPENVVADVLLTLEKHQIPMCLLDEVLSDIKHTVMNQPITATGTIGLSLEEYEATEERILQEIKQYRKKLSKR